MPPKFSNVDQIFVQNSRKEKRIIRCKNLIYNYQFSPQNMLVVFAKPELKLGKNHVDRRIVSVNTRTS